MKDYLKMIGITIMSLVIAVVVYPILHELGHGLVAMCFGAEVVDFALLPLPYVVCDMSGVGTLGMYYIGISGMAFPLVFALIRNKNFWLRYAAVVLSGICMLSYLLSFVSIISYKLGFVWSKEDVIQIIEVEANLTYSIVLFLIGLVCICSYTVCKLHPLNTIKKYFDI